MKVVKVSVRRSSGVRNRSKRRTAALLVAACAGAIGAVEQAQAAVVNWTGASGTDINWSTAGNWNNGLPSANDVLFGNTATASTQGLVDNIVNANTTINSLTYNQFWATGTPANVFHTTQINAGVALNISGTNGLHVGLLNAASTGANVNGLQTFTTLTGGGTLNVTGTTTNGTTIAITDDLVNSAATQTTSALLDMSGLSLFRATATTFIIGGNVSGTNAAGPHSSGTVILADTNVLTTANLVVGFVNGNNRNSSLLLGRSNTISVDTFYVGRDKALGVLQFNPTVTNSGATLLLRGTGTNTRVANFNIADISAESGSGTSPGATIVDLRGGFVDAMIANMNVGVGQTGAGGGGSTSATVFFNNGVLDVTTLTIGKTTATSGGANGKTFGVVNLSGGTTKAGSIVMGSDASASVASGTLNLTGGTVQVTGDILDGGGVSALNINGGTITTVANIGSGTSSIDTFALASGSIGTVGNVFVSTVSGSGSINNLTGTFTLNNAANQAFAGTIAGAGGVTKLGAGTLTLSGANGYTGATLVSGGTVALSGAGSLASKNINLANGTVLDVSAVTTSPYNLNAGQNLGGAGGGTASVRGALAAGTGASLTPGGSNFAGNLNFSSDLTLADATTLNFDLGATTTPGSGVSDLINVTGNLTFNGTTLVTLSRLGADVANGTYQLFSYTGGLTGSSANLVAGGILTQGGRHTFLFDTTTVPGAIDLIVGGGAAANLVWTGAVSNNWNVQGEQNWNNGASADVFFNQDNVTFDDTSSVTNVNLAQVVQPGSITVNTGTNYTFSGTGGISGNASLTKNGTGTLVIANSGTNDYTGATVINAGTLQVGNGGTSGMLPTGFAVTNNATLAFNRSDNLTFANAITGTGNVVQMGPNTLTLSGANTYTGTTTVQAGVLKVGNASGLGGTTAGTVILPGATLDIGGQSLLGESITVAGTGVAGLNGAIVNSGTDQQNAFRQVTISGDTSFGGNTGRWDIRATGGTAALDMGGFNLTKTGNNYVALVGATVFNPGNITENAGTFSIESSTALGGSAANVFTLNGGTMQLFGSTNALPWTLQINGGTVKAGSGTANNWSGPVQLNAASTTFDTSSGAGLNLSGSVSGTGSISKITTGTLTLSGANSFSGTIGISAGIVNVNSDAALGAVPATPINDVAFLGSSTLQFGGSFVASSNRGVVINGTGTTATFDTGTNNVTLGGVISGSGRLTKTGATNNTGNLTLSGTNTFTGNVTISAGLLTITNSDALGAGNKTMTITAGTAGSPSLHLNGLMAPIVLGTNITFVTSSIAGAVFNDAGDNIIKGNFNLSSGGGSTTIESDGGSLLLTGNAINIDTARSLQLQGSAFGTFSGVLSNGTNAAGLVKAGTGMWTLTGSNTYTGATAINGGTLVVNGAIAAGSAVSITNGASLGGGVGTTAGAVGGGVTVSSGAVSPGSNGTSTTASVGVLKAGSVAFSGGTNTAFRADITGSGGDVNAGVTYDQLQVTGATPLTGAGVALALNDGGVTLTPGDLYYLIRGGNAAANPNTITFANFDGSAIDGTGANAFTDATGNQYTLNTNFADPTSGNMDVVLTAVSSTPEPAALSLVMLSGAAILARRKRRAKKD